MKRWICGLFVLGTVLALGADHAQSGDLMRRARQERMKYPPKWQRTSNAWNYVFRDKEGRVVVRKVYPGYAEQFPVPSLFYYGYPHSGDDTGLGF